MTRPLDFVGIDNDEQFWLLFPYIFGFNGQKRQRASNTIDYIAQITKT